MDRSQLSGLHDAWVRTYFEELERWKTSSFEDAQKLQITADPAVITRVRMVTTFPPKWRVLYRGMTPELRRIVTMDCMRIRNFQHVRQALDFLVDECEASSIPFVFAPLDIPILLDHALAHWQSLGDVNERFLFFATLFRAVGNHLPKFLWDRLLEVMYACLDVGHAIRFAEDVIIAKSLGHFGLERILFCAVRDLDVPLAKELVRKHRVKLSENIECLLPATERQLLDMTPLRMELLLFLVQEGAINWDLSILVPNLSVMVGVHFAALVAFMKNECLLTCLVPCLTNTSQCERIRNDIFHVMRVTMDHVYGVTIPSHRDGAVRVAQERIADMLRFLSDFRRRFDIRGLEPCLLKDTARLWFSDTQWETWILDTVLAMGNVQLTPDPETVTLPDWALPIEDWTPVGDWDEPIGDIEEWNG